MDKSFMIYFQIFTTFGYKSLKNSNYYRMLNNKQVMLSNKEGDINKGSLAEHYILNKK